MKQSTTLSATDSFLFEFKKDLTSEEPSKKDFHSLYGAFSLREKMLVDFSKRQKPENNRLCFVKAVTLHDLLIHSQGFSLWIKSENTLKNIPEELLPAYEDELEKSEKLFPEMGMFQKDDEDTIRFEPLLNLHLLKVNLPTLLALNDILEKCDDTSLLIKLREFVSSDLRVILDDIAKIEIELQEIPKILIEDFGYAQKRNTSEPPKVSVITASYNLAGLLDETMQATANQSCKRLEHIVIDGGSTDGSQELIKKYPNVVLVSEKDSGYPDAFWKGLHLARGEYITQCCVSDGYATEHWAQKCMEVLDENPDVSLVWGFAASLTRDSKIIEISTHKPFWYTEAPQKEHMFDYWIRTGRFQPEVNLFVRKSVLEKCYPSVEDCKKDILDWLEFAYRFNSAGYLSIHLPILANFSHKEHENQLGAKNSETGLWPKQRKNYDDKVRRYRKKLIFGFVKHTFIDPSGNALPLVFDVTALRRDYAREHLKKYLEPARYARYIKKILSRKK